MKCKSCETELEEKQKYCSNCGERVEENSTSEERIEENSTIMDRLIKEANKQPGKKIWLRRLLWISLLFLGLGFSGWFYIKHTIANDPINGRWRIVEGTEELSDIFKSLIIINRNLELRFVDDWSSMTFRAELSDPQTNKNDTTINEYHSKAFRHSMVVISDYELFELPTSYDYENKTKAQFEVDFKEMIEEKVLDSRTFTKHEVKRVKKELAPLIELYLQIFEIDRGKTAVAIDPTKIREVSDLEKKLIEELELPEDTLNYRSLLYGMEKEVDEYFDFDFILYEDQTLKATNSAGEILLLRKAER